MAQRSIRINSENSEKEMSNIQNEYCNRYSSDDAVDQAIRQANFEQNINRSSRKEAASKEYTRFMQILPQEAAKNHLVLSANGALEYATTGSALTDFNARATELRNAEESVILDAAGRAYAEDPVKFVKLLFQTGDIRGGKGERRIFNTCMDWLAASHPAVAGEVLALIPEYTRWDYLVRQTVSGNQGIRECATGIVVDRFHKDLDTVRNGSEGETVRISLLAKWMPSLQTKKAFDQKIVRHLLKKLHMQEREYRKALSELRGHLNIIEKAMSAKDCAAIDMEKLSSKQQLRYANFFQRVMAERRHA